MSAPTPPRPVARVAAGLAHRFRVLSLVVRRRRPIGVLLIGTVGYLLAFLYALGDLSIEDTGRDVVTVADPWSRMFEPGSGPYTHEPIALVELEVAELLFSPLNVLLGLGLAILVGANLALTVLAITQPRSCGIGASTGLLAAVPALLGGTACCAPVLLLVLGIQAGSLTLGLVGWLLPIGAALLVATLAYLAGKIDPRVLARADEAG